MEERALPRGSSTLAPPPLETAASGTRALQRFDLGGVRLKVPVAPAAEPAPEAAATTQEPASGVIAVAIAVTTVKMSIPESVKNLPAAACDEEASIPRTLTLPLITAAPRTFPKAPARPIAVLNEAAWALGASVSLVGMGSLASAVVYVLLFP